MHGIVRPALVVLALLSCTPDGSVTPIPGLLANAEVATDLPAVRVNEIHYDNTGTDAGEAIEIAGPAGTDLTGWTIVLYNGSGGAVYDTDPLSGTIVDQCDGRGTVVLTYPSNGIQNGSPDGIALVDAAAGVVEFLSYEGTFTAVGGPANGMTSTDIGASEVGNEPLGQSLQRTSTGAWVGPMASTFGACNSDPVVTRVAVAPASATVAQGGMQQFTGTAFTAANQPIAGVTFTWSSTAPTIAEVNATGLATGLGAGEAGIVATSPNGVADTAELTVDEAPPPPPPPGTVHIVEVHYDNAGTDEGEAIEIEAPAGTSLAGWSVVLYNGNGGVAYDTKVLSAIVPATCGARGVVVVTYPVNGIQNGAPDGMALVDPANAVAEFLSYEGTFTATNGPASGLASTDIEMIEGGNEAVGQSLQKDADGWYGPVASSFGACNVRPGPTLTIVGRSGGDPALPVGFQDQLFATVRDAAGVELPLAINWSSDTPDLASIDQLGVFTALAAGTALLRATAADGTTATISLVTRVATQSAAQYVGNAEFGEPADADPSDDFILRRTEFTGSYSRIRGTPNWVSYDLDATHFGPEDRCDCFTFDPDLPPEFPRYTTADYTGAGEFHGFGIDRGHLARSFDRTAGSLDNARTFLFTNIIPQAADQNQGPWAVLETHLGDLARFQDREVYIVAGVAGSKGTVKDEGRITIPASTWKVAVVMPRDHGLGQVTGAGDVELIAVIMPNDPGVRNVDWQTYRTTVDAVEALSGYDLLAFLPDHIEVTLETPVVAELAAIAASQGEQHPKLRDAQAKMEAALRELAKQPADRRSALGSIEGAVGDLEAAVKDGLAPVTGMHLMNGLAGLAREFAVQAIRDARLRGAGTPRIRVGERFLQLADARRAAGRFKDAAAKYKDALTQAEGAR